jgi:hypothetical protein
MHICIFRTSTDPIERILYATASAWARVPSSFTSFPSHSACALHPLCPLCRPGQPTPSPCHSIVHHTSRRRPLLHTRVLGQRQRRARRAAQWPQNPPLRPLLCTWDGPFPQRQWSTHRQCWREAGQRARRQTTMVQFTVLLRTAIKCMYHGSSSSRQTRPCYVLLLQIALAQHQVPRRATTLPESERGIRSSTPHGQRAHISNALWKGSNGLVQPHLAFPFVPLPDWRFCVCCTMPWILQYRLTRQSLHVPARPFGGSFVWESSS